ISVILPTYNVGRYIERCLSSCLAQTYPDFEILIVDDRGEDDSIKKAERFARKDSRVRILTNPRNMGTYHARRLGLEKAGGKYILFLDPDDEVEHSALSLIAAAAAGNPDVVLFGVDQVPKKRFYQKKFKVPELTGGESQSVIVKKILTTRGFNFGTAGKVYRQDVLQAAYRRISLQENERHVYSEDSLLFASVMMGLRSAVSVTRRLYINHKYPSSITMSVDPRTTAHKVDGLTKSIELIQDFEAATCLQEDTKKKILRLFYFNRTRIL